LLSDKLIYPQSVINLLVSVSFAAPDIRSFSENSNGSRGIESAKRQGLIRLLSVSAARKHRICVLSPVDPAINACSYADSSWFNDRDRIVYLLFISAR